MTSWLLGNFGSSYRAAIRVAIDCDVVLAAVVTRSARQARASPPAGATVDPPPPSLCEASAALGWGAPWLRAQGWRSAHFSHGSAAGFVDGTSALRAPWEKRATSTPRKQISDANFRDAWEAEIQQSWGASVNHSCMPRGRIWAI